MRFVFVKELIKYTKKNRNVYLITSDLGYRAFEEFSKLFPKKFINVGVSENNMIGIAAGMAANGKPIYNESGKVMKGPKYFKPDLSKFVN